MGHAVSWCVERRGCGSCVHTLLLHHPLWHALLLGYTHHVPAYTPRGCLAATGCVCVGALRAAIGCQLPQTHLVIDKHLTDLPLYLAGHLGNAPGVCLRQCAWSQERVVGSEQGCFEHASIFHVKLLMFREITTIQQA